jgi:hypothetical protein
MLKNCFPKMERGGRFVLDVQIFAAQGAAGADKSSPAGEAARRATALSEP